MIGLSDDGLKRVPKDEMGFRKPGGAEGSRTPDLLNAIEALSQLSYGPTRDRVYGGGWPPYLIAAITGSLLSFMTDGR